MNTLGISILTVVVATVLFASKRWALMAFIAGVLFLTQAQQVEMAGFNMYAVRFVELAGFARVTARRELTLSQLNSLDRTLILLYVYTVSVFVLRSSDERVYQIGTAVDALLSYFAFRALIDDRESFRWALRVLALVLIPYTILVVVETVTSYNPFSAIGGVELERAGDRWFRDGRLRATGSFGHPSLMGTLGGSFLPLYIGLWLYGKERAVASLGVILCIVIVWASNSGGPATCAVAAGVGWMLWGMRDNMHWVRYGFVFLVALLAALMKAPVWYLLARLSSVSGGDGWHRAALLDVAFQNVDKWWLAGMPLLDTSTWLPYTNTNTGAVDMTNHFLVFGITAGVGAILLMVTLIVRAFGRVGMAVATVRDAAKDERQMQYIYWGLGVTVWVHVANWFSITYWDQIHVVWFMHLAMISGLTDEAIRRHNLCAPTAGSLPQTLRPDFATHVRTVTARRNNLKRRA
jgi:hypothetical protein